MPITALGRVIIAALFVCDVGIVAMIVHTTRATSGAQTVTVGHVQPGFLPCVDDDVRCAGGDNHLGFATVSDSVDSARYSRMMIDVNNY